MPIGGVGKQDLSNRFFLKKLFYKTIIFSRFLKNAFEFTTIVFPSIYSIIPAYAHKHFNIISISIFFIHIINDHRVPILFCNYSFSHSNIFISNMYNKQAVKKHSPTFLEIEEESQKLNVTVQ